MKFYLGFSWEAKANHSPCSHTVLRYLSPASMLWHLKGKRPVKWFKRSSFKAQNSNEDFNMFICSLVDEQKRFNSDFNWLNSFKVPAPKIIISSTKSSCVRKTSGDTLIPFSCPSYLAFAISLLRPSAMITNKKGDKGQPWRSPLEALKDFEGDPLIITAQEAYSTQPRIQFTVFRFMPIWVSASRRKTHQTLS